MPNLSPSGAKMTAMAVNQKGVCLGALVIEAERSASTKCEKADRRDMAVFPRHDVRWSDGRVLPIFLSFEACFGDDLLSRKVWKGSEGFWRKGVTLRSNWLTRRVRVRGLDKWLV